jgi:hypothetical protein
VRASTAEILENGVTAAESLLNRLDVARRLERQLVEARLGVRRQQQAAQRIPPRQRANLENAADRAAASLEAAGAALSSSRMLEGGLIEVTFRFMGERFISVVDAITLQVADAGICLSGEDRLVTLDSLPSVIKEAIDTDQLNITRR